MNSAEEISTYNDNNSHYCSPVLARKNGNTYSFPEKSPKKDKKWSFGSLFRRKKKESDSTSDDEGQSRSFLQKKKKKSDKRKRVNNASGFDHVVVPSPARQSHTNCCKNYEDSLGILSEPIMPRNNFIPASDFTTRSVPLKDNHDCLNRNELNRSNNSLGSPSVSSLGRRKKGYVKARAEARRDTSKGEESSDDDSQLSVFRSDESLTKSKDGSTSKRSRAARTQRYLRRLSKDDEFRDHIKITKTDTHENSRNLQHTENDRVEIKISGNESPILSAPKPKLCFTNSAPPPSRPNFSGLTTIPPSHSSHNRYRTVGFPNVTSNKHLSYHASYNDTGNKFATDINNQRSLSCESNMHNSSTSPDAVNGVLHIEFPLLHTTTDVLNSAMRKNPPPPPPPRDPRRIITVQNGDSRPISYSFENGYKTKITTDHNINKQLPDSNQNFLKQNFRSTSEDHISTEPLQRIVPAIPRPSSATTEMNRLQKINRNHSESDEKQTGYRYLTDKNPRSRKPICIQPETADQPTWSQKTFNFWRQKDEQISRNNNNNNRKSTPASPLMFTAQTHVTTNIFLPNNVNVETPLTNVDNFKREGSPFRPIASPKASSPNTDAVKRKSSNLEDALDELEAIYNSLHLGDEDLLDRAEKREAAAAQKRRDAAFESFPDKIARNAVNDSSFGFDPNFDSTRKKRSTKKSEPNIKTDDMAFRKLNRERYNTITDAQSAISNMSYLLTSPVFNSTTEDILPLKDDEPNVTFDDVVFRNVMRLNSTLKVVDPQPPFGIPMGPISPASNSDYLHAVPEPMEKFTHSSKKIPDVVKDDLAYRTLRKDPNKGSTLPLPHSFGEEYFANDKFEGFKKKRAVRSLSANIGNLMHKNDMKPLISITNDSEQNITDVADALEIARQILRDKEEKINATRLAFMSDGELKYRRFDSTSPTDQRARFLNEMKSISNNNDEHLYHHKLHVTIPDCDRLDSKPPTPDRRGSKASTKESTPIPSSPSDDSELKKQLRQSTLDELLTSLAVETRETSDKITEELNLIATDPQLMSNYEKDVNWNSALTNESCDSCVKNPKREREDLVESSIKLKINDDSTMEHVKLCEKLLQCVVANQELSAANTEELVLSEEVAKIDPIPEIVANIVLLPTDRSKLDINPVSTEVFSESDHDYVNIHSADESEKDREIEDILQNRAEASQSKPKLSRSVTEMNGRTAEDNADLLAAFEVVDETLRKMNIGGSTKEDCIEQTDKGGGETCFSVEYIALPTKGCAYNEKSQYDFNIFDQRCDESEVQNFVSEVRYHNSNNNSNNNNNSMNGTETKCNFKIGGQVNKSEVDRDLLGRNDDSLESLKSPKLVKHLSENYKLGEGDLKEKQKLGRRLEDCLSHGVDLEREKNICDSTMIDSNSSSNLRDLRHTLDETQPSCAWYENPGIIALACSLGIACTTQLPSLDIIAVLGLLFAIISLLLALLARI